MAAAAGRPPSMKEQQPFETVVEPPARSAATDRPASTAGSTARPRSVPSRAGST